MYRSYTEDSAGIHRGNIRGLAVALPVSVWAPVKLWCCPGYIPAFDGLPRFIPVES
ncbi:hypothetical protein DPMN_030377 [Dreissena polymorpha]|uniref:Uncharacterized protein n=1 Tax=Dreissena polymorpha TaxID=45954 RepID=A0A9D4M2H8_DREPO|nr:hypothetical protein DPMN_030377 [Dreissena polymorpha]